MANCSSEKDTLLDQIASLEEKVSKLEKENSDQRKYIKFLQRKLHDLNASSDDNNDGEVAIDDEDQPSDEETEEYKDFD